MWSCIVCRRPMSSVTTTCLKCQAVVYCSESCRMKDFPSEQGQYSHSIWCEKMLTYMEHNHIICDLPFTYAPDTTSPGFTPQRYKSFLTDFGVYDRSLWKRDSASCKQGARFTPYGDMGSSQHSDIRETSGVLENPYMLPEGMSLCHKPRTAVQPTDWLTYYTLRELPLHSPLAILLTHALTVYHIILLHYSYTSSPIPAVLHVHLLGVEKEVELLPTFKELAHLLPTVTLCLWMFGDTLSPRVHGVTWQYETLTIHIAKGLYHDSVFDHDPHLAIGLNAGLVAYSGWSKTLQKLKAQHTPAYFTDYCEQSAELSQLPVSSLRVGSLSRVTINPFRSPVRVHSPEHHMATFSNAFIFSIVYS